MELSVMVSFSQSAPRLFVCTTLGCLYLYSQPLALKTPISFEDRLYT